MTIDSKGKINIQSTPLGSNTIENEPLKVVVIDSISCNSQDPFLKNKTTMRKFYDEARKRNSKYCLNKLIIMNNNQ